MKHFVWIVLLVGLGLGVLRYALQRSITISEDMEDRDFVLKVAPLRYFYQLVTRFSVKIGLDDVYWPTRWLSSLVNLVYYPVHLISSSGSETFPGVQMEEIFISGIRVKLYIPPSVVDEELTSSQLRSALLYFHGGGFIFSSSETYHYLLASLALHSGIFVVAIDYRKAPTFRNPIALEDSLEVAQNFLSNCQNRWNIDPHQVFVAGDSAGGYLAIKVTAALGTIHPLGLILVYPIGQLVSFNTPSFLEFQNDFSLSRDSYILSKSIYFHVGPSVQQCFAAFRVNNFTSFTTRQEYARRFNAPELTNRGSREQDSTGDQEVITRAKKMVESSPLFEEVESFPATLIISSKFDILRDDSVMLERRLLDSDIEVTHSTYASYHGFITDAPDYKPSVRAIQEIISFIDKHKSFKPFISK